MPGTTIDRDHKNKTARFNALGPLKVLLMRAEVPEELRTTIRDHIDRFAILVNDQADERKANADFWQAEYNRLAMTWHLQGIECRDHGWEFDATAKKWLAPEVECVRCATEAWNAGADKRVGLTQAQKDSIDRKELLARGYDRRHVQELSAR